MFKYLAGVVKGGGGLDWNAKDPFISIAEYYAQIG